MDIFLFVKMESTNVIKNIQLDPKAIRKTYDTRRTEEHIYATNIHQQTGKNKYYQINLPLRIILFKANPATRSE